MCKVISICGKYYIDDELIDKIEKIVKVQSKCSIGSFRLTFIVDGL